MCLLGAGQHPECKLLNTKGWLLTSSWSQLPSIALFLCFTLQIHIVIKISMRNWCCLASLWTEADFCLSMKSPISQIRKRLWKRSTCKYLRLNEGCLINNTPYYYKKVSSGASEISLVVKNLPANAGDIRDEFDLWVRKIPWRRAWYPTPVFLPRKFLWTEEPDGLQSVGSQRVGHDWSDLDICLQNTPH